MLFTTQSSQRRDILLEADKSLDSIQCFQTGLHSLYSTFVKIRKMHSSGQRQPHRPQPGAEGATVRRKRLLPLGRQPRLLSSGWILSLIHPWAGHLCAGPKPQKLYGSGLPSLSPPTPASLSCHLAPPFSFCSLATSFPTALPHSSSPCPPVPVPHLSVSPQHLLFRISQLHTFCVFQHILLAGHIFSFRRVALN